MDFFPDGRDVPPGLETTDFLLEPLTTGHVELDYRAVMAGTAMLRVWSGSGWPADDFTLAENGLDLERHDREHRERTAFTFTVLAQDRTECLGCVYITSAEDLDAANPGLLARIAPRSAVVGFWLVPQHWDRLARRFASSLRTWILNDWPFPTAFFAIPELLDQQVDLMATIELSVAHRVSVPERTGGYLLYGPI